MKNFIFSPQIPLLGHRDVIGFGDDSMWVEEIGRDFANFWIINNHYSGTIVPNAYVHLAVMRADREIVGVLQFGYAMNPSSASRVVADTDNDEYLELNRMWISDVMPRNSESKAISYAMKFISRRWPKVGWVQSFADERCNCLGVVYQAANFLYLGEHRSTFWELDGNTYHNSMMTRDPTQAKRAAYLQGAAERAVGTTYRQFRYVFFLKNKYRKKLLMSILPYPKRSGEVVHFETTNGASRPRKDVSEQQSLFEVPS